MRGQCHTARLTVPRSPRGIQERPHDRVTVCFSGISRRWVGFVGSATSACTASSWVREHGVCGRGGRVARSWAPLAYHVTTVICTLQAQPLMNLPRTRPTLLWVEHLPPGRCFLRSGSPLQPAAFSTPPSLRGTPGICDPNILKKGHFGGTQVVQLVKRPTSDLSSGLDLRGGVGSSPTLGSILGVEPGCK